MKLCAFLLGFVACLAGCSAKEASDPYPSGSDFCQAWGKAACNSQVVKVCSGMTTTSALTDACVVKQQTFCQNHVPTVGYSSAQAQTCLDAVSRAYSDATLTGPEITTVRELGDPCNHLIKGPAAVGDSCNQDNDCDTVNNVLCVMKSGVGTCVVPKVVPNGTDCSAPEADCQPGFYCDSSNCVQAHAVGKACTADFECAEGLACSASQCTTRVNPGMCSTNTDCTTGVCDITGTDTTGTCVDEITLARAESLCGDLRQ